MDKSSDSFDAWCIVELFGHQKTAGRVTEQTIGGCSFVRVDVPEMDGVPAYTKFYGQGAIYSMSPVTEEIARAALARIRPLPVETFYLPAPRNPKPERDGFECDDDDENAD